MALNSLRLRRALSPSSFLLHQSLHQSKPLCTIPPLSHLLPTASSSSSTNAFSPLLRMFTSTTSLLMSSRGKVFDPNTDEIGPDTILFEGCDYNHWLITVDFPKDSDLSREQMIETYVNIAAQIFGSLEEAKKKIYALSTTTYKGFQVECSEETSEKFKSIPGVVFVLPDSYIDPVNKEYGGDKYVNGEIFPRPPPVHYGRQYNNNRNRRQRGQQDYGHLQQQNYQSPLPQQNYQQPPQRNYAPPMQQNYQQPPQRTYQPPQQQTYQPSPQHNYQSSPQQYNQFPSHQNYPPSSQQNYEPQPRQSYGQVPQQPYTQPPQQHQGQPPQQSYGQNPQQQYGQPQQQNYGRPPNFNQGEPGNYHAQQGNTQRHVQPEQREFSPDSDYGSPLGGDLGQGGRRNY